MTPVVCSLCFSLCSYATDAAAGCEKDTDCKGDRLCVDARCVFPNQEPASAPSPSPAAQAPPPTEGGTAGPAPFPAIQPPERDPVGNAKKHLDAGVALMEKKSYAAAVAELETAMRLHETQDAVFALAYCYKELKRYGDALGMLDLLDGRYAATLNATMTRVGAKMRGDIGKATCVLDVNAIMSGVSIFIDGSRAGEGPLPVSAVLAPGTHEVRVERPKATPIVVSVSLAAGETRELEIPFEAASAMPSMSGSSRDPGADAKKHLDAGVALMQAKSYAAALTDLEAAMRLHQTKDAVFALAYCYKELKRYGNALGMLDLLEDRYAATLDRKMAQAEMQIRREIDDTAGVLNVSAVTSGALIFVDGALAGKGPLPVTAVLVPGTHVVRVERPEMAPIVMNVSLAAGESRGLDVATDAGGAMPPENAAPAPTPVEAPPFQPTLETGYVATAPQPFAPTAPGAPAIAEGAPIEAGRAGILTGWIFDVLGIVSVVVGGSVSSKSLALGTTFMSAGSGLMTIGSVIGTSAYTYRHGYFVEAGFAPRGGPKAAAWVLTGFTVASSGASIAMAEFAVSEDSLGLALGSLGLMVVPIILEAINAISVRDKRWQAALTESTAISAGATFFPAFFAIPDPGRREMTPALGAIAVF
jgi:tetratricopeptide (TPR) repeat protein